MAWCFIIYVCSQQISAFGQLSGASVLFMTIIFIKRGPICGNPLNEFIHVISHLNPHAPVAPHHPRVMKGCGGRTNEEAQNRAIMALVPLFDGVLTNLMY